MNALDPRALEALKNNQRQLDMDGCEVGVSRQALDELLAAYEALSQPQAGESVQDTWFTDRALPVMAMSADVEDNRVLKLHFRRPVTDDDRKTMCDALNVHQASLVSPQPANTAPVTDAMVEHMVHRFLRWKLPDGFTPDGGIQFIRDTDYGHTFEPVGTNLFTYTQADAMVRHMLEGLPAIGAGGQAVAVKVLEAAWTDFCDANPDDLTSPEDLPDHALMTCAQFVEYAMSALSQPHAADERVVEALRRMLRLFDDQGNLIADFAQMQSEIGNGYQALSATEGR